MGVHDQPILLLHCSTVRHLSSVPILCSRSCAGSILLYWRVHNKGATYSPPVCRARYLLHTITPNIAMICVHTVVFARGKFRSLVDNHLCNHSNIACTVVKALYFENKLVIAVVLVLYIMQCANALLSGIIIPVQANLDEQCRPTDLSKLHRIYTMLM
jgi:hypothetical protein